MAHAARAEVRIVDARRQDVQKQRFGCLESLGILQRAAATHTVELEVELTALCDVEAYQRRLERRSRRSARERLIADHLAVAQRDDRLVDRGEALLDDQPLEHAAALPTHALGGEAA